MISGVHYVVLGCYPYMEHLLEMEACQLECPVVLLQYLREVVTLFRWREWDWELAAHPDPALPKGPRLACRAGQPEGPYMTLTFLGLELDSSSKLNELIQQWKGKKSRVMKYLESLIGKLAHD